MDSGKRVKSIRLLDFDIKLGILEYIAAINMGILEYFQGIKLGILELLYIFTNASHSV